MQGPVVKVIQALGKSKVAAPLAILLLLGPHPLVTTALAMNTRRKPGNWRRKKAKTSRLTSLVPATPRSLRICQNMLWAL